VSDPTGGSRARHRANADKRLGKPQLSEADSLAVEAYGPKGAAMRKTAGKMSEGVQKAESTGSKIKKFFTGG
jgi:hypothetical protein